MQTKQLCRSIVFVAGLLNARKTTCFLAVSTASSYNVADSSAGRSSRTVSGRSSGRMVSSTPRTTARSIAFSSSRTLPGQE